MPNHFAQPLSQNHFASPLCPAISLPLERPLDKAITPTPNAFTIMLETIKLTPLDAKKNYVFSYNFNKLTNKEFHFLYNIGTMDVEDTYQKLIIKETLGIVYDHDIPYDVLSRYTKIRQAEPNTLFRSRNALKEGLVSRLQLDLETAKPVSHMLGLEYCLYESKTFKPELTELEQELLKEHFERS